MKDAPMAPEPAKPPGEFEKAITSGNKNNLQLGKRSARFTTGNTAFTCEG